MSQTFPLSALVGQQELVRALLICAVAPEVGGVLIRGQRGTAKSTAVRALAPLLPPVAAADGQPYCFAPGERSPAGPLPDHAPVTMRPAPLVELPVGATLDRLLGTLDLGRALAGEHAFEAGLLARAHGGILYVDEVNLLADHLVDALLDAAASGVARVEREAVSVEHDARFVLIGTMNPEEGELRPQLLDRFGLGVEVAGSQDPAVRAEIVRRRLAFQADPDGFCARFADAERQLAQQIAAARQRLRAVRLPERELVRITTVCAQLAIDGVRGDLVWAQAARALAALDGSDEVNAEHVRAAAALALSHRRRSDPLEPHAAGAEEIERALERSQADRAPDAPPHGDAGGPDGGDLGGNPGGGPNDEPSNEPGGELQASQQGGGRERAPAGERREAPVGARLAPAALALGRGGRGPSGRRGRSSGTEAVSIDSRPAQPGSGDLALAATLRCGELREHVRAGRDGALLCLILDCSGSMGARKRLARVKGAVLSLLRDAYQRRDRVALITFRDAGARMLLAPGAPPERAAAAVRELATGGRTPLAHGLNAAATLLAREAAREPNRRAIAVLFTDGRAADPDGRSRAAAARLARVAAAVHVVDTEEGRIRLGLARVIAAAAGARLHPLGGLA